MSLLLVLHCTSGIMSGEMDETENHVGVGACWRLLFHPGLQYFWKILSQIFVRNCMWKKPKAVISSFLVVSNVVYKYDQSNEHAISLQVLRE